ncbi:hypothetical protein P280DRAFT_226235 [Massarina eburnea CBS 473.64]|uniref:Fucose-specific lectin n=1 Tax=Massarina eburnea CBS 473.64 TaxID=1395130 RepID=A0A6A6S8T9_9PLEO|nr:hypothetical protein P280DRAFT_226235 [Massarina eburnea CBS 473.64]
MDASDNKLDTTYKIDGPPYMSSPIDNSPSLQAPEKAFPNNPEPASSKEVINDAPEVVGAWLASQQRPVSPFSTDRTAVSGFQPLEFDEKGEPVSRRESGMPAEREKRTLGIPDRYLAGAILLLFAVLVALGLGLGLGLGMKKQNQNEASAGPGAVDPYCVANPEYCIGGALGSSYYTSNGTFNGSGIALATEFWNNEQRKIMTIYFQHWSGEIRSMQLTPKGEWIGGTKSELIASDAKNATPISAVSYSFNETSVWHIFYISKDGHIKQKQNSNDTNIWQDGPISSLKLAAYDAPNVGIQACWYGNYYGDSDANNFPTRDGNNNTIPFNSTTHGMHFWYPTNETTFVQYGWYEGQKQWVEQHTWTGMNAHAGVGCFSWGPGTVTYAMMVDEKNTATVWWKDTDTNVSSTELHPINTWENATQYAIPNVDPSSSLGYTEFFYTQSPDGSIVGHDINWAAERTSGVDENTFAVGGPRGAVPGLKGTHISVTAVDNRSGGKNLYVFYQTHGDDLSVFTRDWKGGQWTQGELPISED